MIGHLLYQNWGVLVHALILGSQSPFRIPLLSLPDLLKTEPLIKE